MGFLKSLKITIEKFNVDGACIVAWDTGLSTRRLEIHEGYKVRPEKTDEELDDGSVFDYAKEYMAQRAAVNAALQCLGVKIALLNQREADDIIAKLVAMLKSGGDVTLMTEDKDFYQLIDDDVQVWRPILDKLFDAQTFWDEFGFDPTFWIYYRAMTGDPSDGIDGVRGVGDKTAAKVVKEMRKPGVTELMNAVGTLANDDHRVNKVLNEEETIRRNFKLLDLKQERFEWDELGSLKKTLEAASVVDIGRFHAWAKKFELESITEFIIQWGETFRRLS